MSVTKANWFVAEPAIDDEPDPFSMPVEEAGERIDLTDPSANLNLRLVELLRREGNLDRVGITCPVKDQAHTCCHACPISKAHVPEESLSVLCRIGREQEKVLTELAAISCQGARA